MPSTNGAVATPLLDVKRAAALLGVTTSAIYRAIATRRLAHVRVRRCVRLRLRDLLAYRAHRDAWLKQHGRRVRV